MPSILERPSYRLAIAMAVSQPGRQVSLAILSHMSSQLVILHEEGRSVFRGAPHIGRMAHR